MGVPTAFLSDSIEALWYRSILFPVVIVLVLTSLALQFRSILAFKAGFNIYNDEDVQLALQNTSSMRNRATRILSQRDEESAFDLIDWLPSMPAIILNDLHTYMVEPWSRCLVRGDTDVEDLQEVSAKKLACGAARPLQTDLQEVRSDFSGAWRLARVEGEPEHVAYNAGLPKAKRLASAALGWGVGIVCVTIRHDGNQFQLSTRTPLGSGHAQLVIGQGAQWGTASDGGWYQCAPSWAGIDIVSSNCRGGVVSTQRRSMRGDAMIIETTLDGYYPHAKSVEVYSRD